MSKLKTVTFRIKTEDFEQLIKMLEIGSPKYTISQRNIFLNFLEMQKDLRNSV